MSASDWLGLVGVCRYFYICDAVLLTVSSCTSEAMALSRQRRMLVSLTMGEWPVDVHSVRRGRSYHNAQCLFNYSFHAADCLLKYTAVQGSMAMSEGVLLGRFNLRRNLIWSFMICRLDSP